MDNFLNTLSSCVWGSGLILLLLLTGAFYTVKLRGVQFRLWSFLFGRKKRTDGSKESSQRKTVCMALGTAMGTGNITGVAAAVAAGGAGAVFWMWVSAFFGMALVYAENSLAALYSRGNVKGPMAYMCFGLNSRKLAGLFAIMCTLAAFGMGGMVQVNSFADSVKSCSHIDSRLLFGTVFILILLVTSGGAARIGTAAQLLLPAAAVMYSAACIAVLISSWNSVPTVFRNIFTSAFGLKQASGGISGYAVSRAVSVGIRRGIFSNEAGLGSSPIVHSAADSASPETLGMWSVFEVFFDTFVCCTLTALVILCAAPDNSVNTAFSHLFGVLTDGFIASELAVFSFCTVIGWYYCGETAFSYLSRGRYIPIFCTVFSAASALGAVASPAAVWTLSDIFNGLMAFPNLIAVILLANKVKRYNHKDSCQ